MRNCNTTPAVCLLALGAGILIGTACGSAVVSILLALAAIGMGVCILCRHR